MNPTTGSEKNVSAPEVPQPKTKRAPGKLADVTVLSKDILTIPEDEIPKAQVDYTIVGGKVLYLRSQ
ncbi:MAG TPA: amidohydrolase family protein [Bryobacteraceae bacterium]|jgi:hypothetical protein|nr:amidohydrolase family protein [Bryobacteraceae bacterium]